MIAVLFPLLLLSPALLLFCLDHNPSTVLFNGLIVVFLAALFKKQKHWVLFAPFLLLIPVYWVYIVRYETFLTEQILAIVLETHYQEAKAFVGNISWLILGLAATWLGFCTYLCVKTYQSRWVWQHKSRFFALATGAIYFVMIFLTSVVFDPYRTFNPDESLWSHIKKETVAKNAMSEQIKASYPLGLMIALRDTYREQETLANLVSKTQQFSFQAHAQAGLDKSTVVLVIGESSRAANWQLNGYARETNPLLSKQSNLVNLNNMLSIANNTRLSVPMMITRKPENLVESIDFAEKSVISAFKEAGYKTYWLSNQQKYGTHDTSTSVYIKEADEQIFANYADYTNPGSVDGVLLPHLNKILTQPENKKLIILHLLGSHVNYTHRYPDEFRRFTPDTKELSNADMPDLISQAQYKNQFINAYDNSILYTDFVLNEVIETLKRQTQTPTFLLYASDHGEDLQDGECTKTIHGNMTVYDFQVSALAWYSDVYQQQFPEKIAMLHQNQHRKMNHTAIVPTLLDSMNISIANDSLPRSLLKNYADYPRYVMNKPFAENGGVGVCKEIK